MELQHPILISQFLGFTEANKHIFYTWLAMGILFLTGIIVRRKLQLIPTGLQNICEMVIGGLEEFTINTMGSNGKKHYGLLCGVFLYIAALNLLGLVPGCDAPTANINTNAAMALFVFVYYNYLGIRTWGVKYVKHFSGALPALAPFMLIIELISHLARPLSLTLRLFGNIRGEEIVLLIFFIMAPILATTPIYFLFALAKILQSFIFYMLTMLYIKGALEEAH